MVLYPFFGGVKGISVVKAVSFSSLGVSFQAEASAPGSFNIVDRGNDFLGHDDSHSLEDHGHHSHDDHEHGDHEHGDHEHEGDHEDHGEHEDHEDLEHEHDEQEGGDHYEEEMEAHADEVEVEAAHAEELKASAPGAGRDRVNKLRETDGKPTEGMAPVISKVVKSVAAASLMVSAASRLVEERSKELGLAPWSAAAAACLGTKPLRGPPREGRRKQEPAPRHADFVL